MVRFRSLYVISVSQDVSWDNVPIACWTAVESNMGIICACLPSLKQLLSTFFPILVHSSPSIELRDVEEAWDQRRFSKSTIVRSHHAILTDVSGPGLSMDRIGLTVPLKVLARQPRMVSGDVTAGDMEDGAIKVTTVIEQGVGDKTENAVWPLGQ
jgi:hypothetical protein